MISRIYIIPKGKDSREKLCLKSWAGMGLLGKLKSVSIVDSYLIDSDLDKDSILKSAQMLTNTKLEHFSINEIPETKNFQFAVEIGFLPGVTDNVASTTKETIMDLLHLDKNLNLKVYTSKIYIISGSIKLEDVKKIASSLYNPLIERAYVADFFEVIRNQGFPLKVPEVILEKHAPVIPVNLSVSDDELIRIGREGILDKNGVPRGQLALDLASMKNIQAHFKKLGRDPNDIELESIAQTWSEALDCRLRR